MLRKIFLILKSFPVKTLLQDLTRNGLFSCIPARSCKILQEPVRSCGILQESCTKFLQDSCKIPQDLAGMQEKRTFSCKILQERFYWVALPHAIREIKHPASMLI